MEEQYKLKKIYALIIVTTFVLFLSSVAGLFFKAQRMEARAKEVSQILADENEDKLVLGTDNAVEITQICNAIKIEYIGEFKITAYCPCEKCCGKWAKNRPVNENGKEIIYTASGQVAQPNMTVGVDTSVIPFGTRLLIDGNEYIAQDTGSKVKDNVIDIYFETHEQAVEFGCKYKDVYILSEE